MDLALALDALGQSADIVITPDGDLGTDASLRTAVLISLLTDRRADPDDVLPDGGTDRRGWWADAYAAALPDGTPDLIGSKLWLRARCTATQDTANQLREDCLQALAWMVATGAAADVAVTTAWASATGLNITITIAQHLARAAPTTSVFTIPFQLSL